MVSVGKTLSLGAKSCDSASLQKLQDGDFLNFENLYRLDIKMIFLIGNDKNSRQNDFLLFYKILNQFVIVSASIC